MRLPPDYNILFFRGFGKMKSREQGEGNSEKLGLKKEGLF